MIHDYCGVCGGVWCWYVSVPPSPFSMSQYAARRRYCWWLPLESNESKVTTLISLTPLTFILCAIKNIDQKSSDWGFAFFPFRAIATSDVQTPLSIPPPPQVCSSKLFWFPLDIYCTWTRRQEEASSWVEPLVHLGQDYLPLLLLGNGGGRGRAKSRWWPLEHA